MSFPRKNGHLYIIPQKRRTTAPGRRPGPAGPCPRTRAFAESSLERTSARQPVGFRQYSFLLLYSERVTGTDYN